jgi:hypothetical protein
MKLESAWTAYKISPMENPVAILKRIFGNHQVVKNL